MSYLEYSVKHVPTGLRKILHLNWPLTILLASVAGVGFLMLYSVAGGSFTPWAEPQMKRFALGLVLMIAVGMVPIWMWRNLAGVAYVGTVLLLLGVEFFAALDRIGVVPAATVRTDEDYVGDDACGLL